MEENNAQTTEKTEEPKRKFKKRYVIIPVVIALALGVGAGIGYYLYSVYHIEEPAHKGQESEYIPDMNPALSHYEEIKSADKDYTKLAPYEALNVAYELFQNQEVSASIGVGYTIALFGIRQEIYTSTVHRDGKYMDEEISLGTIDIYDRSYQDGANTTKYWGDTKDYSKDTPTTITNEEYAEQMGKTVSDPLIYIVSEKTESKEDLSGKGLSKITKLENGYGIDIELDKETGVINYQKQMQTISELAGAPTFKYLHLYVVTDLDLNLRYLTTTESYEVVSTKPFRIRSACTGSLTVAYLNENNHDCKWVNPTDPVMDYPKTAEELLQKFNY